MSFIPVGVFPGYEIENDLAMGCNFFNGAHRILDFLGVAFMGHQVPD